MFFYVISICRNHLYVLARALAFAQQMCVCVCLSAKANMHTRES